MFAFELRSFCEAGRLPAPALFDRGVPDRSAICAVAAFPRPNMRSPPGGAFAPAPTAFIAPPWPDIFRNDDERGQSPDEAERPYEAMVEVCSNADYELEALPLAPVEERVGFVTGRIRALLTA